MAVIQSAPAAQVSDGELVARARAGDQRAFGVLVRRYQRRVYAVALQVTGNHGDADDVAQEALVRAYRGLAGFDGRSELFTWLYRITVNTALNHLRAARRAAALVEAGAEEVAEVGGRPERPGERSRSPAEVKELDERLGQVLEAVAALSPSLRITLVLATVEQLSYQRIAEVLEIPAGTVGWRVNEARRQLRARLAALNPDEDDGV